MVLFLKVNQYPNRSHPFIVIHSGFTDPITVKFANTPNAVKSMVGLPLAPSYIPAIPTSPSSVLTTIPPIRQQLNRYRYAHLLECIS